MASHDDFTDLARFYDPIMREVNYDRWLVVSTMVADLCAAEHPKHVDLACGTGTLLKRLIQHGWDSVGIDISPAMLREASKGPFRPPVAVADLCRLPFGSRFDYATCVFDSLNFLLAPEQFDQAITAASDVLVDGGVFYFDVITERMVTHHFADMKWTEDNGKFSTTWEGSFDRETSIAEIEIRVNTGTPNLVRERVYSKREIEAALKKAGFTLLIEVDAENWTEPSFETTRVDRVAVKGASKAIRVQAAKLQDRTRQLLRK